MSYDPIASLVTWLKTQAAVTTHTSTRIWGGPVPRTEQTNMPRKCLSILSGGGPGPDRQLPDGVTSVQARCYGASIVEGRAVYDALLATVHRKHHIRPAAGQCLVVLHVAGEPMDLEEPATGWPFTLANIEIRYTTDATS